MSSASTSLNFCFLQASRSPQLLGQWPSHPGVSNWHLTVPHLDPRLVAFHCPRMPMLNYDLVAVPPPQGDLLALLSLL